MLTCFNCRFVGDGSTGVDNCNPPADASKNLSAACSVLRFGGDLNWRFTGDWLLAARLRTQVSGQSLLPGEKFGVGGAQVVQGHAPGGALLKRAEHPRPQSAACQRHRPSSESAAPAAPALAQAGGRDPQVAFAHDPVFNAR